MKVGIDTSELLGYAHISQQILMKVGIETSQFLGYAHIS